MKKLIFTAALMGFSSVAFAQTTKSPEQKAKMETRMVEMKAKKAERQAAHLAKMKADLNLNNDQVAKIEKMHADFETARKAEFENQQEMKKNSAMKMKAKKEKMKAEMKTILSPDQYNEWEKQQLADLEKRKEKMQERKAKMKSKKVHKQIVPIS